jgi:hypothetical protein
VSKKNTCVLLVIVFAAAVFSAPAAAKQQLDEGALRHLAGTSWWGGTYPVPDGEHVSIHISTRYPQLETFAQQWVSFFAGLPHGHELSLVKVFVAPVDEVEQMCLSDGVLGCYQENELVTVGDARGGLTPTSVAAHEYGHHIAFNRLNPPWRALDWGTKRWASLVGICARAAAATAFPGDEGGNYSLNPGEGFAESYRVLVETGGTAVGYAWPIVDPSFRPDGAALAAVREDVLHPWSGPTAAIIQGRFGRKSHVWTRTIYTPLDGDLSIRISVPGGGGADELTLRASDGRTLLAKSAWDGSGGKAVTYRICGTRSLKVRVTRGGAAMRFTLRIASP